MMQCANMSHELYKACAGSMSKHVMCVCGLNTAYGGRVSKHGVGWTEAGGVSVHDRERGT